VAAVLPVSCNKNNRAGEAQNKGSVTVEDGTGHSVTVGEVPSKIISLGAASTEILFEIGAEKQIAAVSDVSNYPEAAKSLPTIGGFDAKTISIEKIVSFNPDLIIIYSGMHDFMIASLEKFGIPYYVSKDATISDVIDEIRDIAYLTGHKSKGDELSDSYKKIVAELSKSIGSQDSRPKVYWEVYNNPYMSIGKNSFMTDVVKICGGKNIFDDVEQDYPVVSEETIIASNPDFILLPNDMFPDVDEVKGRAGWQNISAVKNGNIVIIDADIYTRPGPRIFAALQSMNKILYGKAD
jgi:iron complex transport system substrate-binding protein